MNKHINGSPGADERLVTHERELTKLEQERTSSLENQATGIMALVVAIGAFAVSALDRDTLEQNLLAIGAVVAFMFLAAGFAIAARGPRALKVKFWTRIKKEYRALEKRLAAAEQVLAGDPAGVDMNGAILESWRARRAVASFLAERKAVWVTCALGCLLTSFAAAGLAILIIVS